MVRKIAKKVLIVAGFVAVVAAVLYGMMVGGLIVAPPVPEGSAPAAITREVP